MKSKEYLSIKSFKESKFSVVKNIITPDMAKFLYEYVKLKATTVSFKKEVEPEYWDRDWDGHFTCEQCPNTFSHYGDPVMDTLGIKLLSEVSRYTGEDVCYTYSYYRFYQKGDVLKKHTDRKSCDISATVYLGSDTSNLDYPYSWPFFVKHEKEDLEIHLNPGDIVLYRGCDLPHWRNECECLNHGQVFLHYNKNGEDASVHDGRVLLGVPKRFQRSN